MSELDHEQQEDQQETDPPDQTLLEEDMDEEILVTDDNASIPLEEMLLTSTPPECWHTCTRKWLEMCLFALVNASSPEARYEHPNLQLWRKGLWNKTLD